MPHLVELLRDSVAGGTSVGFLLPLAFEAAEGFWLETFRQVNEGKRILLVSCEENGEITGSVQLALAVKENGMHRAEVQKLLVHSRFRRRGIAGSLMSAVEDEARKAGRTLLVHDTEQGSAAEKLYAMCGYTQAGYNSAICSQRGRLFTRHGVFLSFAVNI